MERMFSQIHLKLFAKVFSICLSKEENKMKNKNELEMSKTNECIIFAKLYKIG